MTSNGEEEENGGGKQGGRPNAWWAKVREEQLEEQEGDGYGGAFRGVKAAPRGGSVTVTADQILGTDELCWCGQSLGHSWPGKNVGAKHPKVENMSNSSTANVLDRRDLRAFHRRLQDFVLACINDHELRYRQTKNGVILYPADGSTPMTVHARNTDRQLRSLQKWYLEHVYVEPVAEKVDEAALQRLAEAKNDPVEHPSTEHEKAPEKAPEADVGTADEDEHQPDPTPPKRVYRKVEDVELPEPSTKDEWVPVMREKDGPSDYFVTNGEQIRCIDDACKGTDHEYIKGVMSQGGHIRMYHTDTTTLHGPEAKARAVQTARENRQKQKVISAIDILAEAVGHQIGGISQEDFDAMKVRAEKAEARAVKAEARAEELDAKLSLIREATGL